MTEGMQEDPRVGTVVQDRYRILERLSSGSMGVVYRAERVKLGRIVAVKFLHPTFAQSADSIRRFELEARTMSRLEHPHCVGVIDFGVADSPFIVMEFVTGTTLRTLVDQGPVAPRRALTIARQMLAGLAHAHEKGIIHRDVKPANVMLAQATGTGDHVRLLDFGLAKLHDADASASSMIVGTPSYMAPEQASGKKVDARTDVYATGVVLFELLTGEKPFFSDQALDVIRMHIEAPPPRMTDKAPSMSFSPELEGAVARALAKDPGDRFQTPGELAAALEQVPEWTGARAATAPVPPAPAAPPAPAPAVISPQIDPSLSRAADSPQVFQAATDSASGAGEGRGHGARWLLLLAVLLAAGGATWWLLGHPGWSDSSRETAGSPTPGGEAAARDQEIQRLHEQRRQNPGNAVLSFRLATLYREKGWFVESLAAVKETVEKSPSYKSNPELNRMLIDFLGNDETSDRARVLILKHVGPPARPFLETASRNAKSPAVRAQAKKLLEELAKLK